MIAAPRLVLIDSITQVEAQHAGALVVTGSHGGVSSAGYAREVRAWLYVFNDAGGGKDDAGKRALELLQQRSQPAATVAHTSARIGEAADAWHHGIVSAVNAAAAQLGCGAGRLLSEQLRPESGDVRPPDRIGKARENHAEPGPKGTRR